MAITRNPPPVTIVVPVYGDLPTLTSCVESLKQNVDLKRNRVLLVNDCGPDADVIEASLLAQIEGWSSIRYERNERNLGLVGTCNRAVTELDTTDNDILLLNSDTVTTPGFLEELSAVLHLSPLHGIVCARSNNAWIASFPFTLRDPSTGYEIRQGRGGARRAVRHRPPLQHLTCGPRILLPHSPRTDYAARAFRRRFFARLLRGVRLLPAHERIRVLIDHRQPRDGVPRWLLVVSRSKAILCCSAHETVFVQRYPFYWRAIQAYLLLDRDPVDVFADALVPADEVRRVLVDIDAIPAAGLPDNTRALLAALQKASDPKRLVASVSIPDDQRDSIAAQYPALQVIHHSRLDRLWDVAVASGDTVSRTQLIRLNRVSPRWVFTSTGIGGVRTWRKRAANSSSKALAQDAIGHADGIIALRTGVTAELESYRRQRHRASSCRWHRGTRRHRCRRHRAGDRRAVWTVGHRHRTPARAMGLLRSASARYDCPAKSFIRRLIRRAEYAAPRPVGYAKGVVRKLRG